MRIRLLHPGFFTDPVLCGLSDFDRLIFQGLWLLADRDGRLVDSVKMVDGALLALDDRSSREALVTLAAAGRIVRYETNGVKVIQVKNFAKYQHIHPKEAPSKLPGLARNGNGPYPDSTQKNTRPDQSASTSTSTSTSTKNKYTGAHARPVKAKRGARPHDRGTQQDPRRLAADGRAKRAASATVDHALVKKIFG